VSSCCVDTGEIYIWDATTSSAQLVVPDQVVLQGWAGPDHLLILVR
jgi:hypothetical protein